MNNWHGLGSRLKNKLTPRKKRLAMPLALAIVIGSAGMAIPYTVSASVGAQVTALAAEQQASAKPAAHWPISLGDIADGQALAEPLIRYTTEQLKLNSDEAGYLDDTAFCELNVGGMPDGYTRQFFALVYTEAHIHLLLLATDATANRIVTLADLTEGIDGELAVNTVKSDVSVEGKRITVWSQLPFRATQSVAVLEWDGANLNIVSHEYSDPSYEYFEAKAALLSKGDMKGLIALSDENVSYPLWYEEYFSLPGPTLQLAHRKALETYRKGDAATAAVYLRYGLDQYAEPFGLWDYEKGVLTMADLKGEPDSFGADYRLAPSVLIGMLNDYGFFLSETKKYKEALPILTNVLKLAPSRTAAYLNVADTEWALGKKTAAKVHYKQYVKLLGKNASKAPKRVKDRINAK